MRAARYHGKEDIRIEQIDEPSCGKGQVKVPNLESLYMQPSLPSNTQALTLYVTKQVAPAFVGICGTEYADTVARASTPH